MPGPELRDHLSAHLLLLWVDKVIKRTMRRMCTSESPGLVSPLRWGNGEVGEQGLTVGG